MNVAASAYHDLRQLHATDTGVLLNAVTNATSLTECGFAIELLRDRLPERTIVGALNLRETLDELPSTPFAMPMEFERLARVADLACRRTSWIQSGSGPDGAFELELLGQGNLVYDLVLHHGDDRAFFKPGPVGGTLITPLALDLVMRCDGLLRAIVELTKSMGVVYNPHFYMKIEEWQFEHARDSLGELSDLF